MVDFILIPDTMVFSRNRDLLKRVIARPDKKVILGCHDGIALECWTQSKINVSRSLISNFMPLVHTWFREPSEAVRLTHSALINGKNPPDLQYEPVRALAEKIKIKLAVTMMPDSLLQKFRLLRKKAQNVDRDHVRNITTINKAGIPQVLPEPPEKMIWRCLDPSDKWGGLFLDTVLNNNKVDGFMDPNSQKHTLKLATLLSRLHSAPGFRLHYCHIAFELLKVMYDVTNQQKIDPSNTADSDHLIYLSPRVKLISEDSALHTTQDLFGDKSEPLILRPQDLENWLDSKGVQQIFCERSWL